MRGKISWGPAFSTDAEKEDAQIRRGDLPDLSGGTHVALSPRAMDDPSPAVQLLEVGQQERGGKGEQSGDADGRKEVAAGASLSFEQVVAQLKKEMAARTDPPLAAGGAGVGPAVDANGVTLYDVPSG